MNPMWVGATVIGCIVGLVCLFLWLTGTKNEGVIIFGVCGAVLAIIGGAGLMFTRSSDTRHTGGGDPMSSLAKRYAAKAAAGKGIVGRTVNMMGPEAQAQMRQLAGQAQQMGQGFAGARAQMQQFANQAPQYANWAPHIGAPVAQMVRGPPGAFVVVPEGQMPPPEAVLVE